MKSTCLDTQMKAFFQSVNGAEFKSFKEKIMKRSATNNIEFNEDVFMDTIVRCLTTFSKEDATNIDVEHYFWRAFKQNSFSYFSRNKFRDAVNFDVFGDGIINEDYNADIDEIVDLLKNEVEKEFGSQICDAWILHICYGYTYTELEQRGYEGLNLHNEFRQIKRHIFNRFAKENKKLKTLLIDNNFI
jgi:hypothetical protein